MPPIAPGTSRGHIVVCLGLVWVIWGSIYLAIRLVINEVDPFQAMAQRFLVAGLLLAAIVALRVGPRALLVTPAQLRSLVLTGVLLLGLGNGLQALAQRHGLPSGIAALVVASVPMWAVVLRLVLGDRPAPATLAGVGLGLVGLVLLILLGRGAGGPMPLVGLMLCLGASLAWIVGSHLQGVVDLPRDTFVIATYQQFVAGASSALLAATTGERFSIDYSVHGWLALAYLVVACSVVGFVAYSWLLTHVPLSLTSTHSYVNPVVAVLLGWAVLGEPIGLPVLVGGGLVVGSVFLMVWGESRAVAPVEESAHIPPR
ncbi:EamA family transporter [Nocardioides sp. YJ-D4]